MVNWLNKEWSRSELLKRVGHIDQIAGIRPMQASDGSSRSMRILQVDTGSGLSFQVSADRTLDISHCSFRGLPLTWSSPGGNVHPAYYESRESGWLRSFAGGLVVTCGLDQFGEPATNELDHFGLHGRVSHIPANQLNHRCYWKDDQYILEVSGQIRQQRLFGENLLLSRRIVTSLGSNCIRLEDTVTNEGYESQPHMLLYHCNLGFPLISENTKLVFDSAQTTGCDERAQEELDQWQSFQKPTNAYHERVYRHEPASGSSSRVSASVENPAIGTGLQLSFDKATLPYLFQWKVMAPGVYVLGLEPANCGVMQGRNQAQQLGELPMIEPAESRHYYLEFEVLENI